MISAYPTTVSQSPDSGELSKLVFNNSVGCVKILDLDGNLLAMNEGGKRALEVDDFDSMKGRCWASLWPQDLTGTVCEAVEVAKKGGHAHFFGFCPTAKGTPKWWTVDVTPLCDGSGRFDRLLAVSHDVSELQKIRSKLEEINVRRDLLMEIGEIGEWSLDLATGVAQCSESHDRCFGFNGPVKDWTFSRFLGCVHPKDRVSVESKIRQAIANQEVLHDEYRVIWPNGIVHWIGSIGTVHATNDAPRRWLGVVQDITARKRAEALDRGKKIALEKIIGGFSLSDILSSLCLAAEEHFGERVFSCVMVADAEGKTLHRIASPSLPELFCSAVNEIAINDSAQACGQAAYLRQSIYIDDIQQSALNRELKELAGRCGLRACWTIPIISAANHLLGTFALYYKMIPVSIESDRSVVEEIVTTIGMMIDRFQQAEQKARIDQTLRQAQARLEATLKTVEVATWSYDIRNDRLDGDSNLRRLLSLSPGDTNHGSLASFLRAVHPNDYFAVKKVIQNAVDYGIPYETQYRVRSADGTYHTVLARGYMESETADRPPKMCGVLLDITRQQEAEEGLRISRERYYQLFRSMDQGVCVVEIIYDKNSAPSDCRYVEINPAFEKHTGLHDVCGKTFSDVVPDIEKSWTQIYADVARTGLPVRFEHESAAMGRWYDVQAYRLDADSKLVSILFTDITSRKTHEKIILGYNLKLDREANYDALTGLPNRRLFQDRLAQEILARERDRRSVYLLFLDLDHFKEVNDLLGHSMGDLLLKEIAARLQSCVRANDTVARLGGDEFTIVLVEDAGSHVEQVAQKILRRVSEICTLGAEHVKVSCSIGITVYPNDAANPEDLIRNADQAMYLSKTNGRNQLTFFEHSMHAKAMERLKMIGELREALPRNEISLYFQPIVDLYTGKITKAEALVRWCHPREGIIFPGNFISLAEETGIIHELGDWVFRNALACVKRWKQEFGIDIQVSINKSPKQFLKKGHTEEWAELLRNSGVAGNNIVVEITESVLISNTAVVSENLRQLHQLGMEISIDDFGTGYSSMGYLKRLDANFLKIDQSFVKNMMTLPTDAVIVETIILMGHKLGLKIIAEGVETEQQRKWLESNHCDYLQGYLFSAALEVDDFERLLKADAWP
ncbi:EAL domain-containing protein [Massilia jejuensis]|uniref:EAL domain-containing protein n=1 Tax=Massilia jejuensis TaxID=648894 RepID=A0ABW0PM50_9BURK